MSDFLVKIGYKVDSSEIKKAREEINKTNDSLGKTGKSADNASKKTSGGFKAALIPVTALTAAFSSAGAAVALVGAAAVAAAAATRDAFADIQEINDLALILGTTNEEMAILQARGLRAGVSLDSLGKAIQRQQELISNRDPIFERLGLDSRTLNELSSTQAFDRINTAIADIDDQALKAAASLKVFGEGEQDVIKLAQSFSELQRARERALAVSFDTETLQSANQFDESINSLAESAQIIKTSITSAFSPATVSAADKIASNFNRVFGPSEFDIQSAALADAERRLSEARSEGASTIEQKNLISLLRLEVIQRKELASIAERQSVAQSRKDDIDFLENLEPLFAQGEVIARLLGLRDSKISTKILEELNDELNAEQVELDDNLKEQDEIEGSIASKKAAQARLAEEQAKESEKILEKRQDEFDLVERTNDFVDDFIVSLKEQDAILADINSGEITSLEQLNNRIELEREIASIKSQNLNLSDAVIESMAKERVAGRQRIQEERDGLREIESEREANADNTEEFIKDTNQTLEEQREILRAISSGEIRSEDQLKRKLELERAITELKQEGTDLTDEQIRKRLEEIRTNGELIDQEMERMEDFREFVEGTFEDVGDILSDSISDALIDGRASFADFFADVGELLIRSGIQELIAQVFSPRGNSSSLAQSFLVSLFTSSPVAGDSSLGLDPVVGVGSPGFASADGNVFNGPATTLLGEQGPEAVLPLGRDASGRLGVRLSQGDSGGSQRPVVINNNVTVNDSGGNAQETAQRTSRALDQLMERKFKQMIVNESRSGNLLGGRR